MTHDFFFSRGRVIPAYLEAKIIEAKQKVKMSADVYFCSFNSHNSFLPPVRNTLMSRETPFKVKEMFKVLKQQKQTLFSLHF